MASADTSAVLLGIAFIWTVAAVTPGPNFFVTAHLSASTSARLAGFCALGIVSGTAVWGGSGAFGIHLLFSELPWTYSLLKTLGGSYLIYLGLRLLIFLRRADGAQLARLHDKASAMAAWRLGLLTNLSNPKTAFFTASLFATNMPAMPPFWLSATAVGIMLAVSLLWYGTVAYLFGRARMARRYRANGPLINALSGTILLVFGLLLLLPDYL